MPDSTWRERSRGTARHRLDLYLYNRGRRVGDSVMREGLRVALSRGSNSTALRPPPTYRSKRRRRATRDSDNAGATAPCCEVSAVCLSLTDLFWQHNVVETFEVWSDPVRGMASLHGRLPRRRRTSHCQQR